MRKQKDETYQVWLERVNAQEYRIALNRISKGDDVELVVEEMSQRLLKKILHPLYENIVQSYYVDYNKKSSHINDGFFDNNRKI